MTKFTLLGVSIDQYLNFDQHTISLCSKVSWKLSVLKKSSYLFDLKFRIILFKLFIQSKYDYCSTLFSNLSNKANTSRLDKSFAKSLKKYLGINLSEMDIPQQYIYLRDFKLLPLKIRFFQNLIFFIFNLFKEDRKNSLLESFYKLKKDRILKDKKVYQEPKFFTTLYKFSFLSISIKLLNVIIHRNLCLSNQAFRSMFKGNDGLLISYLNCQKFWT